MRLIYFILLLFLLTILSLNFNFFKIKDRVLFKYPNLKLVKILLSKKSVIKNLENDYNVKFLPKTQFTDLNFKKIKLNFKSFFPEQEMHTFFLELQDQNIWIINDRGNIFRTDIIKIKKNNNEDTLELDKINSNLKKIKVLDTLLYEQKLYVYFIQDINNCKTINISVADINLESLKFENFFASDECQNNEIQIGRIVFYRHENIPGLLVATNNIFMDKPEKYLSQNKDSIFGKILFIDFENSNQIIFSKGHRAPQGLYVENNLILSTEHGPKGGDEINKIIFGENYGWPVASYGDYYMENKNTSSDLYSTKPYYLKNHESSGFKEPIFSFVPSIGISEIIRLPNNFSNHFIDNFLITSLNGGSIYRIKFDKNYNRVIFIEKIFLGKRIRDIKYHNDSKTIFLSLEYEGEIGIITK